VHRDAVLACWAKTRLGAPGFHPLISHMLDSAAVCGALGSPVPPLSAFPRPLCSYIVALHDVGKADPRFQNKDGDRAAALLRQARLVSDEALRLEVVKRMYRMRFRERLPAGLTVQQLRGREGIRVREAYARASRDSGVPWTGRSYDRKDWRSTDPVNRALSAANSCLYGICHAAILSVGYSPALGFIHTGKQLSFVYDIADLYKVELTIPLAFRMAAGDSKELERQVRLQCRDVFRESRLIQRIIPDIRQALGEGAGDEEFVPDEDPALPTDLWTPTAEMTPDPEAAPTPDEEQEASPWS